MFAKLALLTAAVFTALAAATPVPQGSGSCNTGPITCCEDLRSADDASVATLLGLLGVVVQDVTAQVGIQCSPINVIGAASGNAWYVSPLWSAASRC